MHSGKGKKESISEFYTIIRPMQIVKLSNFSTDSSSPIVHLCIFLNFQCLDLEIRSQKSQRSEWVMSDVNTNVLVWIGLPNYLLTITNNSYQYCLILNVMNKPDEVEVMMA